MPKLLSSVVQAPCGARTALLAALERGGGYAAELISRVKEITDPVGQVHLSAGHVRDALRYLEAEGAIERCDGPEGRRGKPRIHYQLTLQGHALARSYGAIFRALFP